MVNSFFCLWQEGRKWPTKIGTSYSSTSIETKIWHFCWKHLVLILARAQRAKALLLFYIDIPNLAEPLNASITFLYLLLSHCILLQFFLINNCPTQESHDRFSSHPVLASATSQLCFNTYRLTKSAAESWSLTEREGENTVVRGYEMTEEKDHIMITDRVCVWKNGCYVNIWSVMWRPEVCLFKSLWTLGA